MFISDLSHVEVISEGSNILGGRLTVKLRDDNVFSSTNRVVNYSSNTKVDVNFNTLSNANVSAAGKTPSSLAVATTQGDKAYAYASASQPA